MHICFIIDNSPLTKQTYTQSSHTYNLHTNITILETIKMSIQSMLNEIVKNQMIILEYHTLHLFLTSQPNVPISSFQHDKLHFDYQLKEVKSSDFVTYPAETLKFAIKHVSKFRVLTDSETVHGYRVNYACEPALIIFFSYGLTLRKIARIQSMNLEKLMRNQYKFIHYRLCYPSQIEKDKNLQKFKFECENSIQGRRLAELAQRLGNSQNKNIIKYQGKQSLVDSLIKLVASYKACLLCHFYFDSQIKLLFPEYFKNSEMDPQKFLINQQVNGIKVQLVKDIAERNSEMNNQRNYIPLPLEVSKDTPSNNLPGILQIQEIGSLQFFIDLGKKLSGTISSAVPFVKYLLLNTPPRLLRIEKQLQRLGITNIFFPVYVANTTPGPKKQKSFFLSGLLHFCIDSRVGNFLELMLSFPNFPYIEWIFNLITNQKSYADGRKIQKLLIDYHNGIPQFYHKFISQYFTLESLRTPVLSIYQSIAANNWANPSAMNIAKINLLKQEQNLKKAAAQEQLQKRIAKKQNEKNHAEGKAQCCAVYSSLQTFLLYSKSISKANQTKNTCENVLSDLLSKISEFNDKNGLISYFGCDKYKEGSMVRQISRYSQKFINEGERDQSFLYEETNQSIQSLPEGLLPRKIERIIQMEENEEGLIKKDGQVLGYQESEIDSIMPGNDQYQEYFTQQNENGMLMRQNKRNLSVANQSMLMLPNSVAVETLTSNIDASQLIQTQRQLLINKLQSQQDTKKNTKNATTNKLLRKQSSINYNESDDEQTEIKIKSMDKDKDKDELLNYIRRFNMDSPKIMLFNHRNFVKGKFQDNLRKLKNVGFIDQLEKYVGKGDGVHY